MVPTISNELSVSRNRSTCRETCTLPSYWVAGIAAFMLIWCTLGSRGSAADYPVLARYSENIQPLLEQYCYGCHGLGAKKGAALDGFADAKAALNAPQLWHAVLKNVRSGIMPPADKPQPSADEHRLLEDWIKRGAGIDPNDPDPGRVTVRRLNRVEYRNTIRDLLGVDYDTTNEFPPDDTGNGFDNNGDVLTVSPLLLEKYLSAANTIISRAVPVVSRVVAERVIPGSSFQKAGGSKDDSGGISLSYYEPSKATSTVTIEHEGRYRLLLDLKATEKYVDGQNDQNRCRVLFLADGEELCAAISCDRTTSRSASNLIASGRPRRTRSRWRSSRWRPVRIGFDRWRSASSR